tara:strand:- start:323 stop:532 length:210 start_codon:yes stop_codon:yes gene_type:complete
LHLAVEAVVTATQANSILVPDLAAGRVVAAAQAATAALEHLVKVKMGATTQSEALTVLAAVAAVLVQRV